MLSSAVRASFRARGRRDYTAASGTESRTTDATPPSIARGSLFADLRGYSAWVERHGDHAADAVLLWSFDGRHLFGRAMRDDRDMTALLDWWEDVGRFAVP